MDDGRVIPARKFSADARGKAGGPTVEQLKQAVKEHLAAHPEINTTVPQQLLSDVGYELIYTPPYVSELQPIELIWAFIKDLVARQSTRKRSVEAATIQTRVAMEQVTAELCQKVISHCHKWMQQFMKSEEGGSLQQFADLKALMQVPAKDLKADDLASMAPPTEEEEEEEQTEARWA